MFDYKENLQISATISLIAVLVIVIASGGFLFIKCILVFATFLLGALVATFTCDLLFFIIKKIIQQIWQR